MKIKFLKYIIQLKGGGEIGYALIESVFRDEDINIKTFRYPIQEGYWVKIKGAEYRNYRTKVIQGYIINDKDTIYGN